MAGRQGPSQRRRGGLSLPLVLIGCAVVLGVAGPASAPGAAAESAESDAGSSWARGWEFVPLGPEGADFVSVVPIDAARWLGQSARGQLFCWMPYDSAATGGAWERVPVCGEGTVTQMARVEGPGGEGRVIVLLSNGSLLTWDPQARPGEWACPPGAEGGEAGSTEPTPGDDGAPAESRRHPRPRPGDLRRWAALPEERALSVVSALAGAGGPVALGAPAATAAPEILLVLRDGAFFGVHRDGSLERWRPLFLDPAAAQDPRRAEEPPRIRIRWAGRLPDDPSAILAITEWEGLFASRDGGRSFSPVVNGLPKGVRAVGVLPGGGLCAACTEGLFVRRDPGAGWQASAGQCGAGEAECRDFCGLLAGPRSSDPLLARTSRGKLLRSQDGGLTWDPVLSEIPVRVRAMAAGLDGRELVLATSRGVLVSRDGGASWQWRNQGLRQAAVLAVAIGDDGEDLFLGTDLGFYARAGRQGVWLPGLLCAASEAGLDAATWQRLSGRVYALDLWESAAGYRQLGLGTESGPAVGGWDRESGGCGWSPGGPQQSATSVLVLPGGDVWAAGRTADGFWTARREPSGAWVDMTLSEAAQAVHDPAGPPATLVHCPGQGDDEILLAGGGLTSLGAARDSRTAAAAGPTAAGNVEPRSVPGPPGCIILSTACADGSLWAGTDDGLWRTRDGAGWQRVAFSGERAGRVALAGGRAGVVVCRTSGGVHLSEDDGTSWLAVPVPEQLHVLGLAIDDAGSRLYLGTQMGLFMVAVPSGGEQGPGGAPTGEEILPLEAQPNPFSSQVILRGVLGATRARSGIHVAGGESAPDGPAPAGDTGPDPATLAATGLQSAGEEAFELLIVNVHGQLVRRIGPSDVIAAEGDSPYLEWSWDGRDERGQPVPGGIYLVSARVGNTSYRGKVIKLR